ncbi:hypothetical protein AVEN_65619-1, partial [Araneus ventricosus]
MTTAVRDVEMVGHVHWFQYENGIRFPAEIGVSEVLPFGIPEDRRRAILTSVDNTGRIEYAKDRPVNRVASRNISRLPFGYEGLHTKEAERKIIRFVQDKLLAIKGHDQKVYFESLGLTVVELKSVLPCCPKYSDLPEVFHPKTSPRFRHSIHYKHDDRKCSRIIAISKYVKMKRREESDKYWDDQAKSSESSDWSKYWDEQAESSEWDDEPADKPIPESSSDEPKTPAVTPAPNRSQGGFVSFGGWDRNLRRAKNTSRHPCAYPPAGRFLQFWWVGPEKSVCSNHGGLAARPGPTVGAPRPLTELSRGKGYKL